MSVGEGMGSRVCMRKIHYRALLIVGIVLIGASAGAHAKDAPLKSRGSTLPVVLPTVDSSSDRVAERAPPSSVGEFDFISPEVIERARQRITARASVDPLRSRGAQESDNGQYGRVVAAKLPLPNTVIARTIERIGYACGAVASARALEGNEPGAYKVTCTSGQSYQARPLHGRYHFRRW